MPRRISDFADFEESGEGGASVPNISFRFERELQEQQLPETFQEALQAWMANIGVLSPEDMVEYLGLDREGGITAEDLTNLLYGNAAPGSRLIQYLSVCTFFQRISRCTFNTHIRIF